MFKILKAGAVAVVLALYGISGAVGQQSPSVDGVLTVCPGNVQDTSCHDAVVSFVDANGQPDLTRLAVALGEAALLPGVTLPECLVYADGVRTTAAGMTDGEQRASTNDVADALCTGENFRTAALGDAVSPG
jgi:hypothetical protein